MMNIKAMALGAAKWHWATVPAYPVRRFGRVEPRCGRKRFSLCCLVSVVARVRAGYVSAQAPNF